MANMAAASKALSVRVVSYNVLSSHLAAPTHFHKCNPDHLEADNRLTKIFSKLQEEILASDSKPIFCLQEVSQIWAGKFHTFFAKHNYQMITGLYGKKFNGYMGIAVAYPAHVYDVLDVDIARLSDTREGGWPQRPPQLSVDNGEAANTSNSSKIATLLKNSRGYYIGLLRNVLNTFIFSSARKMAGYSTTDEHNNKQDATARTIEHWDYSEGRQNILIFARFCEKRAKDSSKTSSINEEAPFFPSFCVSNYHMPCAFFAPMVMTIHAEMAAKRTQALAASDPYILAGDFNILKLSSTYDLLTTGILASSCDSFPTAKYGIEWKSTIRPMKSAYAQHHHGEPDFTNYAHVGSMTEPFIETLDYIFLSEDWRTVKDVKSIYHSRTDVIKVSPSFPNEEEPSDHVLIAATVEC